MRFLNSNNENVERKCSKFEVEGIIVVKCRKYCSSARILPAVSESQGCGKMFEENAFFALGEKIFALDGKIFASDTTNRLQALNP